MIIYFDTEFTVLGPGAQLISLGMVTDRGKEFYAEFTDYNLPACSSWLRENVLSNLLFTTAGMKKGKTIDEMGVLTYKDVSNEKWRGNMYVLGNSNVVLHNLIKWLEQFKDQQIQLVSDVCHYDMVLLCNLFGGAFNLPKNVAPACYDICQDIAARKRHQDLLFDHAEFSCVEEYNEFFRNIQRGSFCRYPSSKLMKEAFDKSREKLYLEFHDALPEGSKHNSLYDAKIIKGIYEGMRKE